jgi:hypothetical protein
VKTSTATLEDRYKAALTDVRLNSDVLVFDNFPACCGSCAGSEIETEHPDAAYVFFINQQGRGLTWENGKPYNFETDLSEDEDDEDEEIEVTTPATKVWFNHSNLHAASVLRAALVKFGLTVDWDGTDGHTVILDFTA